MREYWRSDKAELVWTESQPAGQKLISQVALCETPAGDVRLAAVDETGSVLLWKGERDQTLRLPQSRLAHRGLEAGHPISSSERREFMLLIGAPGCVAFSEDGSVVAAGFGALATLWAWAEPPEASVFLQQHDCNQTLR